MYEGYEKLLFRRCGKVLYVTFNRPAQLNAFGPDMGPEFLRFLRVIGHDEQTEIVVLTGAGRAFSSGGDIIGMQRTIDTPGEFEKVSARSLEIVMGMLDCPKTIIAKVNGPATGLGASIALLCDLVYASTTAKIGDPHVRMGLVAGDGGALIWPQLVGFNRAKQYLLTGDLLTADEAERIGLINYSVVPEELDDVVDKMATRLANGATKAINLTKRSINLTLKNLAATVMPAAIAYEDITAASLDHAEAVRAFNEKRTPAFTGR